MRAVLACVFVSLLTQAAPAQAPEPGLVRIDAIVTDARGARVADLTAEDFEVIDGETVLAVESARLMAAGSPGSLGSNDARFFAIFIDEYHIDGPSVARTRQALNGFIDALGPRDLVILARPLDSLTGLKPTRDRDALKRAIDLFEGRKGDYRPRSDFERSVVAGTPDRIAAARAQIVTSALAALAAHLDSLGAGRKAIVVVSEGFARPANRRDGGLPTIDAVVRAANHAAASIYPLNPGSDDSGSALLKTLAGDTSGWSAPNPGDLDAGLRQVMSDASDYYLLAFRPADHGGDGRFHQVELRVRRPDVTVRARRGYWSAPPEDVSPSRLAARTPRAPMPATHASPLIRPWFGIARGSDGNMRISFVWERAAPVPGVRAPVAAPFTVVMSATRQDGTTAYQGAQERSNSEAIFQTAPGRLRVELAIRDANARLLDTDVRDVIVGALAGPVELGTAEILRSRTAREYRALESDPGATPTASREFSRAERLLVRVPAYASGGGMQLTAILQNRMGKAMRELAVTPAPAPGEYQIDVPLAGLASSDYAIAIAAKSPAGKADSLVTFRVTP